MNATDIPHTLKSLRIALGLTVDALAASSGLAPRSIGDIEAARTVPTIDTASKHARALGISREAYAVAFEVERTRRTAKGAA